MSGKSTNDMTSAELRELASNMESDARITAGCFAGEGGEDNGDVRAKADELRAEADRKEGTG